MNVIVYFVLATALIASTSSDISWSSHGHLPISLGSEISPPSYEAKKAHDQAKYYARKAHDIAKLEASIYGIGHGFYGFRYGSHFPKHFTKPFPLLPFIDKYPLFDLGLYSDPFATYYPHRLQSFHKPRLLSGISGSLAGVNSYSPISTGISGHLMGFGYPKSYLNSYSQSYSYGKGQSYGNKNSYGLSKPYDYSYSRGKILPPVHHSGYVQKIPGETLIYESEDAPQSHGYQYSYVKESPINYKAKFPRGYDSLYGNRYNSRGLDNSYKRLSGHKLQLPIISDKYQSIPSKKIILSGNHGGHGYSPIDISSYDGEDFSSDIESSGLLDAGAPVHKFYDLVAYGSEKSEVNKAKEDK